MAHYMEKQWIWKQYGEDCPFENALMDLFLKEYCFLCGIALSSSIVAVTHYFGKLHKKEIKKWYSRKYGEDFLVPFESKLQIKKMANYMCDEDNEWIWEQYGEDCPLDDDLMDLFLKEHCVLCDIALSSITVAVTHYFGRLHKREIKKWYSEKYGVDFLVPFEPKLQTEKMAPVFLNENQYWIWEQYGEDCPFDEDLMDLFLKDHCVLCNIALTSTTVAVDHYFGRLHKKEIKKWYSEKYGVDCLVPFEPKLQTENMAPVFCNDNQDWIWEQYGKDCSFEDDLMDLFLKEHCILCNISLSSSTVAVAHYFGKVHKKEIKKWYSKKYGENFIVPFEPKLQVKAEYDKEICLVCQISFKSHVEMVQHFEGKKHFKKIKLSF